jgi:ABC-type multidrug transport system permease subunit
MAGIIGYVLFIVDIVMLMVGVWTLVKGALPQGLLAAFFGKGNYGTDLRRARLFGALLIVPIVSFSLTVVLAAKIGEAAINAATLNFLLSAIVILFIIAWVRQIKKANRG